MTDTKKANKKSGSAMTAAEQHRIRERAVLTYDDLELVLASEVAQRVRDDFGINCTTAQVNYYRGKHSIGSIHAQPSASLAKHVPSELSPLFASVGWAGSWDGWAR